MFSHAFCAILNGDRQADRQQANHGIKPHAHISIRYFI